MSSFIYKSLDHSFSFFQSLTHPLKTCQVVKLLRRLTFYEICMLNVRRNGLLNQCDEPIFPFNNDRFVKSRNFSFSDCRNHFICFRHSTIDCDT